MTPAAAHISPSAPGAQRPAGHSPSAPSRTIGWDHGVASPAALPRESPATSGHQHLWSLLDGTPAHAPPGQITTNADGQLACHLCGNWFDHLGVHLRRHGWTADEYRQAVGLTLHAPLCNAEMSATIADRQRQRWADSLPLRREFETGHRLARSGELAKLARAAWVERAKNGGVSQPVVAARAEQLARGRATVRQRQRARLRELVAAAGASDLAELLSRLYRDGHSLESLSRMTGLSGPRVRSEIQAGGGTIRPSGRNVPSNKHRRARDIDSQVAARMGTDDIGGWLQAKRRQGHTLAALAEQTGRSIPWVASRVSGRGVTT